MFRYGDTLLSLINQYISKLSDKHVDQLIGTIGRERLTTYFHNTATDREAMALYELNAAISKHVHELISGFEVALRNAVAERVSVHFRRSDWYRHRIFVMQLAPERRANVREVRRRIKHDGRTEREGRIIAGLTFHFWVAMHENKYRDIIWTPFLHRLWPKGENLKILHKDLSRLRDLRNRIAHHEPIFEEKWFSRISTIWLRFEQLSPETKAWFHHRLYNKISSLTALCPPSRDSPQYR